MTHLIVAVGGFFAGMLTTAALGWLVRRRIWQRRSRPHRYEEIL